MKILIDTNVILDVLLNRYEFYANSRLVFELVEKNQVIGCISSSVITDIFILRKRK